MLCTSRYSLIKHICCIPRSQAPSTSPVAIGQGALLPSPLDKKEKSIQNTHPPVHASWCGNKQGFWVNAHCCTEQGCIPAPGLGDHWVRDDSVVCRFAAFLCITRNNEDLITAAWSLFVCFCAPVHFLSPHGSLPSLGHFPCAHTLMYPALRGSTMCSVWAILVKVNRFVFGCKSRYFLWCATD